MHRALVIFLQILVLYTITVWSACPVEDDPISLTRCIQVDVTAIIFAARGKDDITSLCQLADRYMECIKTYTRGCVGYYFGEGSMSELQNIAQYCCKGVDASADCPLNTKARKCIAGDAHATLSDGSHKLVSSLQVGDKVKTLDSNGNLIDTDVIMILDKSSEQSLFFNIRTQSNISLSVSGSHLMATPGGEFKFAKKLFKDDSILTYDYKLNKQVEDKIESILIEPIDGYAAPLTMSGTILVNNMLASCYAVVDSHNLAHTVMAPVRWWHSMNEQFTHSVSYEESEMNNGTHWYPQFLHSIADQYLSHMIKLN